MVELEITDTDLVQIKAIWNEC